MIIGCNYWASNAGVRMWRDWDETAVRDDLKILSEHGVNTMRVFPTWDDFQPVTEYWGAMGFFEEYRMADGSLPSNADFLDETMLERFEKFCDICDEYNIRLIVGLITGWMSGRLFVPSALIRKNLYTDPTALLFEQRFIRGFVTRFKHRETVYAWDLGNECNCMSSAETRETAANWTALISNAIKANDSTRPVVSGMHSLTVDGVWTMHDQGEFTDILTTHPYPVFVPHCRRDKIMSMRTLMHATCETQYYADISGRPCLVEEIGTLGPMVASDEAAADFLRVNLFSNWANDAPGVLWWCANEQSNLNEPPYAWTMCERELGMINAKHEPKPVLREMKKFAEFLKNSEIKLSPAKRGGVCITTKGQDNWGISYMSYILAKQAGTGIEFAAYDGEIPEADIYLLPSVSETCSLSKEKYYNLLGRVKDGATLYISMDNAFLTDFEEVTGLKITDSRASHCEGNMGTLKFRRNSTLYLVSTGAEVLAEENGNPLFTVHKYGKGTVYYLNFPLEKMLLGEDDAFDGDYYKIYCKIFGTESNPTLGITENGDYKVVINYTDTEQQCPVFDGFSAVYGGNTVKPFDCCILKRSI